MPRDTKAAVLVVGEQAGPREALLGLLEACFEVHTADGAERALELLRSHDISAVTVDLDTIGLDGLRTFEKIRAAEPDLEVIAVTGYRSYETATACLRLHAFDWITKPFESAKVVSIVSRGVEHHRARLETSPTELAAMVAELVVRIEALEESVGGSGVAGGGALEEIRLVAKTLQSHLPALR
jgi:DNA-binding NtrC family response regulator